MQNNKTTKATTTTKSTETKIIQGAIIFQKIFGLNFDQEMDKTSRNHQKIFKIIKGTPKVIPKGQPTHKRLLKPPAITRKTPITAAKIIEANCGEERIIRNSKAESHEIYREAPLQCHTRTATKIFNTSIGCSVQTSNKMAPKGSQKRFAAAKANKIHQSYNKKKHENNKNRNVNKNKSKTKNYLKKGNTQADISERLLPRGCFRARESIEQQNIKDQKLTNESFKAEASELNTTTDKISNSNGSRIISIKTTCCTNRTPNSIRKPEDHNAIIKSLTYLQNSKNNKSGKSGRKKLHIGSGKWSRNSKSNSESLRNADIHNLFLPALFMLIYCSVQISASASVDTLLHAAAPPAVSHTDFNKQTFGKENIFSNIRDRTIATQSTFLGFHESNNSTHRIYARDAANVPDDDDDTSYHDDEFDEYEALVRNKSAKGKYIGAPCNEMKCDSTLLHVTCDKETQKCGCEKNYPVQLGLTKGCDKPKKLGEQCFYDVTCMYNDENSLCVQVRHNAKCQCASGFHSVSYTKPTRRVFCTQDLKELTSDLPTLLGVTTGIAVLAGLICMVLHLFSKTKYPRHRNYADASIPPPIMYSSDTGIQLIVQTGRPSSRSSIRSSGSIGSYGNRRSSSGGGGVGVGSSGPKGILVSTSRTGSRRPSLASVHSTSSSVRSYSMMRFEKETQQKEIRQEMKLRLARLQQQQQMSQKRPHIIIGDALSLLGGRSEHGPSGSNGTGMTTFSRLNIATPSPLTPNSTDELLPAVDESQEYPKAPTTVAVAKLNGVQEIATTSAMAIVVKSAPASSSTTTKTSFCADIATESAAAGAQLSSQKTLPESGGYIGPCSSSSEAL